MKKWFFFSVPLSLILTFVAVPLVPMVYANGNISGTARLRLVKSFSRMNKEKGQRESVDCKNTGHQRCLILRYDIAGVDPGSKVKVGVHKDNCQGALEYNLETSNIPVGDGRDGREVRASVDFTTLPNEQ